MLDRNQISLPIRRGESPISVKPDAVPPWREFGHGHCSGPSRCSRPWLTPERSQEPSGGKRRELGENFGRPNRT